MSEVLVAGAAVLLNNLILFFWKPWLGAYGAEKAKNLARKEDLDKILSEVRAVTATQKQIEAKISVDVWERQKKWEIKRDAFFEAVKELARADDALTSLDSAFRVARSYGYPENESMRLKVKAGERWEEARLSFKKAYELAILVCDQDVRRAFDSVNKSITNIASDIMLDKPNTLIEGLPKLVPEMLNLTATIRKELGIPMTLEKGQV